MSRALFLEARMATILNIADGPISEKAQKEIARLAREAVHGPLRRASPAQMLESRIRETRPYLYTNCCDDFPECMHNR